MGAGPPGANQCAADGVYAPPGAEFCPEYGYAPEPASRARQYAAHPDDETPLASLCLGSCSVQHPAAAQKQCEGEPHRLPKQLQRGVLPQAAAVLPDSCQLPETA